MTCKLKPTVKPNRDMTHHKDGTVSFYNTIAGEWQRGDVNAYLLQKRALRDVAKAEPR